MARQHLLISYLAVAFIVLLAPHTTIIVVHATIDAETGGECVDSDPQNCPFWAATGECKANKRYMHTHCRKSCDRCHIVRVNSRDDINRYVEQRKLEMEIQRDANQRKNEALKVIEGGASGSGSKNGSGNRGNSNRGSGSGGFHPKNPPPKTATATISADGTIENGSSISKQSTTTTTGATTNTMTANNQKICKDIDENCPYFAQRGDCSRKTSTMSKLCRLSCGFCQKSESSDPTTIASTAQKPTKPKAAGSSSKPNKKKAKMDAETGLECVDLDENCPLWAATNKCMENRRYMSTNCRLSCDRCHIVRVNNEADIRKYVNRKTKEKEKELATRKSFDDAITKI